MTTIVRRFTFDAGHRVYGHESKCASIHGHTYTVEVTVTSDDLDKIGRVIDFSVVKDVCGSWIDENLDHGMLLYAGDPLLKQWATGFGDDQDHKYYLMDSNPTAENIAKLLFENFDRFLYAYGVRVTKVVVWETPNCRAEHP